MTNGYFECKPGKICKNADCCRSKYANPSIGIGDYLRISKYTDESILDIWETKGSVSLYYRGCAEFTVLLSFLHDPCPYLTNENKCRIYEVRPVVCALFPFLSTKTSGQLDAESKNFKCLKNVNFSKEQISKWEEMFKIAKLESDIEFDNFWMGKPIELSMPKVGDYFKLASQALGLQQSRDPNAVKPLTKLLLSTVNEMVECQKNGEFKKGLKGVDCKSWLRPVVYTIIHNAIATKIEAIDDKFRELYKDTTEKWKILAKSIS